MGESVLEKLVTASLSDVGRSRSENQDACREARSSAGEHLLVLADGMGGHRGGAEAARMCVETIERHFLATPDAVELRLRRGIEAANEAIHERGLADPELGGMGATCVALVLCPDGQAAVAWVGDSRAYRLRGGALEQLTEDHSLVAEWQKIGVLSAEQAARHPKRNELTRAIGVTPDVEPEVRLLELQPGDRFLLCSDGLCGVVEPATLHRLLGASSPEQAARALVASANGRGGPDNVTVQIAWLPAPPAPTRDSAELERAEAELHFEFPQRPASLPPLLPRPSASATEPGRGDAEEGPRAPSPSRPRAPRPMPRVRRAFHAPSAVLGLLAGIALAATASQYLRWQAASKAIELPRETAATTPPLVPAPKPRAAAPRSAAPPPQLQPPPAATPPRAQARPAPSPAHGQLGAPSPAGEWVAVPEPIPSASGLDAPEPVRAFLDAWLAALSHDDAAAHAQLGFPTSAAEFMRTQQTRESFRLLEVDISPRSTSEQIYLRVLLSYAFRNGSGRFRTEDELRFILRSTPGGLRFAGHWSE